LPGSKQRCDLQLSTRTLQSPQTSELTLRLWSSCQSCSGAALHLSVEGKHVVAWTHGNGIDGRRMVHILSAGVFLTSVLKDMLSLPRPLSPPLQRITMSGHVSLEYGFPSTHSANAVSVAVFAIYKLRSPENPLSETTKLCLELLAYGYALSIAIGRLYCGMHGFLDVVVGSILGVLISVIECTYGAQFALAVHGTSWVPLAIYSLLILVAVRVHPEPADDCPCFDDTVAFSSVAIGIEIGGWHYANSRWSSNVPVLSTAPFSVELLGWPKVILRIVVGVLVVFAWRAVMKPTLLYVLPHIFRFVDKYGMILPRKFFMPASEYKKVPANQKLDNVMPSVSDLPNLLKSIRHPGRGRAVSIGPQSAADAYETLAYREKRRRDSLTGEDATSPIATIANPLEAIGNKQQHDSTSTGISTKINGSLPTPDQSRVASYEKLMGQSHVSFPPPTPDEESINQAPEYDELQEEKEIFSRLLLPRPRYDVEVITKLIVYIGRCYCHVRRLVEIC